MIHVILREGWHDAGYVDTHANGFEELRLLAGKYAPAEVAPVTGLSVDEICTLAREYALARPAVIRLNYGIQRSEFGGAAVRAIAALPVLTGSWKDIGGGLQLTTSGAFEFNKAALERSDLQHRSVLGRQARIVNMAQLGHALTRLDNPAVHALVVYNSNPAAIAPDQTPVLNGFRREDLFTVVLEQFQTDTADYADLLLPVTTFLEHTDLYRAYGHYYLQMCRAALSAPGETRSNVEIFRLLAARMGFDDVCFRDSDDQLIEAALDSGSPFLKDISFDKLDQEGSVPLNLGKPGQPFQPFANGGFRTRSGKFEFGAESLEFRPPAESRNGDQQLRAKYPLELISAKNDDSMNSTLGNRDSVDRQTAVCEMSAEDAQIRDIQSGDLVRLFNDRGECYLTARIGGSVRPGVVRARSTRWNKRSLNGLGINRLTSDRLSDMGGGPTFYSCLVQIEGCPDGN